MCIHAGQANQGSPVLEIYRIPLEHSGRTMPILVRMIVIEKSIPKTLLFVAQPFQFRLRTRLRSQPPAPFDESYDEGVSACHMLRFKRATMRTTRNHLLQIFEILHPGW
jgi:hypothetical protein